MKIDGKSYRTIWQKPNQPHIIQIIDQRWLPHKLVIEDLITTDEVAKAIKEMHVRGAPLIGSAAAFGMYIAALEAPKNDVPSYLQKAAEKLNNTRPTAVNLTYATRKDSECDSRDADI